MAVPTTRETFKQKCLRRLGKPINKMNLSDDQLEDLIDDALKYYADYHYDATLRIYYSHQVTTDDVTNKYITLPENIIGVVRIFDISAPFGYNPSDILSIEYQFVTQALFNISNVDLAPYYIARQNLELINQIINGQQPIRFQRHMNRLYVDTKWETKLAAGKYLLVEAYQVIDPNTYTDIWGDRWFTTYVTAQFKKQYGYNMLKYKNVELAGGITLNAEKIYDEAVAEIAELERNMIRDYSEPLGFYVG